MYTFDRKPERKKCRKKAQKERAVYHNTTQLCPVQRSGISIIVKDSQKEAEGESGKKSETVSNMKKYTDLFNEFERSVSAEPINESGSMRPWNQCAEPNALSNLVAQYDDPTQMDLETVHFPRPAYNSNLNDDGNEIGEMLPCKVCSKWVQSQWTNLPLVETFISRINPEIPKKKYKSACEQYHIVYSAEISGAEALSRIQELLRYENRKKNYLALDLESKKTEVSHERFIELLSLKDYENICKQNKIIYEEISGAEALRRTEKLLRYEKSAKDKVIRYLNQKKVQRIYYETFEQLICISNPEALEKNVKADFLKLGITDNDNAKINAYWSDNKKYNFLLNLTRPKLILDFCDAANKFDALENLYLSHRDNISNKADLLRKVRGYTRLATYKEFIDAEAGLTKLLPLRLKDLLAKTALKAIGENWLQKPQSIAIYHDFLEKICQKYGLTDSNSIDNINELLETMHEHKVNSKTVLEKTTTNTNNTIQSLIECIKAK